MPGESNKKEFKDYKRAEKEVRKIPEEERIFEERREKEAPPERLKEFPPEEIPEEARIKPAPPVQIPEEAEREAKRVKDLPRERQIQALVDLAFKKGLRYSIDTARALKNPYILDAFHDALVDHLYVELVKSGRLKEL